MSIRTTRVALAPVRALLGARPVESALRRLGAEARLYEAYWAGRYHLHRGVCTRRVGDARVDFHVATPDEFRHCETLVGEEHVLADLLGRVGPDDVFYDVGSYLGTYACLVAAGRPGVQTVAFEPNTPKRRQLRRTVDANDLPVEVRPYALGDAEGVATFATGRGRDDPNVAQLATRECEATIEVDLRTVDGLVARGDLPAPTVLKVDVEGAELDALRGARAALSSDVCRLVYCEIHPSLLPEFGGSAGAVRSLLEDCGFDVTRVGDRREEFFLRAEKR